MKSLKLVVSRETYEEIVAGKVSSLTKSITPKNEWKFLEYYDEEDGTTCRSLEEIEEIEERMLMVERDARKEWTERDARKERHGLFALRPVHYDLLRISCIDASLATIHKSVVSEEILFEMDADGNFKEYDANGKEYLMASLRYIF